MAGEDDVKLTIELNEKTVPKMQPGHGLPPPDLPSKPETIPAPSLPVSGKEGSSVTPDVAPPPVSGEENPSENLPQPSGFKISKPSEDMKALIAQLLALVEEKPKKGKKGRKKKGDSEFPLNLDQLKIGNATITIESVEDVTLKGEIPTVAKEEKTEIPPSLSGESPLDVMHDAIEEYNEHDELAEAHRKAFREFANTFPEYGTAKDREDYRAMFGEPHPGEVLGFPPAPEDEEHDAIHPTIPPPSPTPTPTPPGPTPSPSPSPSPSPKPSPSPSPSPAPSPTPPPGPAPPPVPPPVPSPPKPRPPIPPRPRRRGRRSKIRFRRVTRARFAVGVRRAGRAAGDSLLSGLIGRGPSILGNAAASAIGSATGSFTLGALGGSAVGAGAEALAALGPVGLVIGGIGVAAVGAAEGLHKLVDATNEVQQALINEAHELSRVSGQVSASFAISDVRHIQALIRRDQAIGGNLSQFVNTNSLVETAITDIRTDFQKVLLPIANEGLEGLLALVSIVRGISSLASSSPVVKGLVQSTVEIAKHASGLSFLEGIAQALGWMNNNTRQQQAGLDFLDELKKFFDPNTAPVPQRPAFQNPLRPQGAFS